MDRDGTTNRFYRNISTGETTDSYRKAIIWRKNEYEVEIIFWLETFGFWGKSRME